MTHKRRRQRGVPIRVLDVGEIFNSEFSTVNGVRIYEVLNKAYLLVRPVGTGRLVKADRAMVDFDHRRKGLITLLYEAAAEDACRDGNRLVSDTERSPFSEAFWRKQKRKGHARCIQPNKNRNHNMWQGPLNDMEEHLAQKYRDPLYGEPDYNRARREMKKLKLPKPRYQPDVGRYWPCLRWGFKRKLCKEPRPFNLSGL